MIWAPQEEQGSANRAGNRAGPLTRARGAVGLVAACLAALTVLAGCASAAAASSNRSSDVPESPSHTRSATSGPAPVHPSAAAVSSPAGPSPAGPSPAPAAASSDAPAAAAGPVGSSDATNTVQIVVIGDSLTSGLATPGYPWTTPAQQILDQADLPAHIVNSSVSGIGYDNDGGVGITFEDLVRKVVTDRTDIVVLFGSDNDTAGESLDNAVEATVDQVQQQAPHAAVVIVGPPVTPAQKGADLSGIDSALESAAQHGDATYVDASDWFEGKASELLSSDGEHPNTAGEDYLGQKFAALLEPLIRRRLNG